MIGVDRENIVLHVQLRIARNKTKKWTKIEHPVFYICSLQIRENFIF